MFSEHFGWRGPAWTGPARTGAVRTARGPARSDPTQWIDPAVQFGPLFYGSRVDVLGGPKFLSIMCFPMILLNLAVQFGPLV